MDTYNIHKYWDKDRARHIPRKMWATKKRPYFEAHAAEYTREPHPASTQMLRTARDKPRAEKRCPR
eukprot:2665975-Lingulodinium_polyedra.AAC.1